MPSLIDLRRRIKSVKNTQQITKAMKMVSAAKLRRAQQQALASRPYAELLRGMLGSVLGQISADAAAENPLLAQRPEKRVLFVVLAGDKGLCGAFNGQIFRVANDFIVEKAHADLEYELLGRKCRDHFKRRGVKASGEWTNIFTSVDPAVAQEIADKIMQRYAEGEIDAVYTLYSEFRSAMSQVPVVKQVLPLGAETEDGAEVDFIYAQSPESMFDKLLPRYVRGQVLQAMLESAASEHAARMAAMEAATRNAGEMLDKLTLHLNRVRQASITTEIIEVVSGAAALG